MRKRVGKVARGALASALLASTAALSAMSASEQQGSSQVAETRTAAPAAAPAPSVRMLAREIERNLSAYLIAAAHVQSDRPSAPKIAAVLDRDPVCNQALHGAGFVGVAREMERSKNAQGFGRILHGKIALNGHCYDFASGGRGRGSIPPGRYRVG